MSENFWQNKRVIVTGGAGFLGSFVVEKLKQRGATDIFIPRIENYNLGYGAHGEAGYQFPITSAAYLSSALRVQSFQSSNAGRTTEYDNFVPDFTAPQTITMDVNHATNSGATPVTYSVQDLRFLVDLGYRF